MDMYFVYILSIPRTTRWLHFIAGERSCGVLVGVCFNHHIYSSGSLYDDGSPFWEPYGYRKYLSICIRKLYCNYAVNPDCESISIRNPNMDWE